MNKKILVFTLIIDFIFIVVSILVPSLLNYSKTGLKISFLIIGSLGVLNLILIAIFEYKIKNYKSKKYSIFLHLTYAVIAVLGIMVVNFVENYEHNELIYSIFFYLLMIISVIVFIILNFRVKEKPKSLNK